MAKKFTKIDEEFKCEHCGKEITKLKYTCRNHCPYCLYSKHVDINPGDRQEICHGLLKPIGVLLNTKKGDVLIFQCEKCGRIRRNIIAKDDNRELIIHLSANPVETN